MTYICLIKLKQKTMFIIIEAHGGPEHAIIAMDENGENLVFDTREEAEGESKDFQNPVIVEL